MKKVYSQFDVSKDEWMYFGYRSFKFYETYKLYLVEHHAEYEREALEKDYIIVTAHLKWWMFFILILLTPVALLLYGITGAKKYVLKIYHICLTHNDNFEERIYIDTLSSSHFHNLKLIKECKL